MSQKVGWVLSCFVFSTIRRSSACSKTAANKGNFKAAIQTVLDKNPVCITTVIPKDVPAGFNGRIQHDPQMEVLAKVGLVTRTEATIQRHVFFLGRDPNRPTHVRGYRYNLTDAGKKYVGKSVQAMATAFGGPMTALCYGKKQVVDVVRYTEPGAAMGVTATQVTYTWKLIDVADWARDPGVEKAFYITHQLSAVTKPQETVMVLVLSNDGWHAPNGI